MTQEPTPEPAGKPAEKKPFVTPQMAEIEAELTLRRAALASTVDELSTRLDPRVQAAQAVDRSKRLFRDAVDREAPAERRRRAQLVLGAVVAGVVALVVVGRLRRR